VPWAVKLAIALIDGYKLLISPYFAGSCRFLPSCADYAREALLRHGVLRGTWLAVSRLARCHPLCAGGHDPVPPVFVRHRHGLPGDPVLPARSGLHAHPGLPAHRGLPRPGAD